MNIDESDLKCVLLGAIDLGRRTGHCPSTIIDKVFGYLTEKCSDNSVAKNCIMAEYNYRKDKQ